MPAWLIVAAILTRAAPLVLALAVHGDAHVCSEGDSYQYLELAASLAHSGTFSRDGSPELLRTPLYPLLLVPGTLLGAPVLVAVGLQILLGVAITRLVFATAAALTNSPRTATAAAAIYLLEPGQPIHAIFVMADALLTGLVALITWLAVRYRPGVAGSRRHILLMSGLLSAAAYAKPPAYFLGVAVALALVVAWWNRAERRPLLTEAFVLLLVNAALLAPWHARNYVAAGYAGFSTQIERAAFIAAPAAIISARTGQTYADVRARLYTPPAGSGAGARATREYRWWGAPIVLQALPAYAWIHVQGSLLTLMAPAVYVWNYILKYPMEPTRVGHGFLTGGIVGAMRELRAAPLASTLLATVFSLWPLCAVVLCGVALRRAGADARVRALALLVVLWLLIVGGPNRESRHRSPVVPALSVLAALGLPACALTRFAARSAARCARPGVPA